MADKNASNVNRLLFKYIFPRILIRFPFRNEYNFTDASLLDMNSELQM